MHHTRKAPAGTEVTAESSRGAKALTDAARVARALNQMSEEDGAKAGVENHRLFFRAFNDKANLAPPVVASDWFRLASVWLENGPAGGDSVGVVTHWDWPDPLSGVTGNDFDKVAPRDPRGGSWRNDVRSPSTWVGNAVAQALDLDVEDKADKAKVLGPAQGMAFGEGSLVWGSSGSVSSADREKFVEVCGWQNEKIRSSQQNHDWSKLEQQMERRQSLLHFHFPTGRGSGGGAGSTVGHRQLERSGAKPLTLVVGRIFNNLRGCAHRGVGRVRAAGTSLTFAGMAQPETGPRSPRGGQAKHMVARLERRTAGR